MNKIGDLFIASHLAFREVAEYNRYNDTFSGFLHSETLKAWEHLRKQLGLPIKVNSGFRSLRENLRISGSPRSQHLSGRALDLFCPTEDLSLLAFVPLFFECGFRGIGRGDGWVHLDTRVGEVSFFKYRKNGVVRDEQVFNLYQELFTEILEEK